MSELIQFNDEDLKKAIVQYWGGQGITIADETAMKLVEEVRSKMQNQTLDELKLAINQLKLELSSEKEASLNFNIIINSSSKFLNSLAKFSAFEEMKKEEIKEAFKNLIEAAQKAGQDLPTFRQNLKSEKDKLIKRLRLIKDKIDRLNNYDPNTDFEGNLDKLTKNKELVDVSNLENDILAGKRITGKKRKSDYEFINKNQLKNLDDILGVIDWKIELDENTYKLLRVWSRKRFNFEKLLGNNIKKFYQTQLRRYASYLQYLTDKESFYLKRINEIEHLSTVSREKNQILERYISEESNYYKNLPANKDLTQELVMAIKAREENLKKEWEELKNNIANSAKNIKELKDENVKEISRILNEIQEIQFNQPAIADLSEKYFFDPDFITWAMGKKGITETRQYTSPFLGTDKWNVETGNKFDQVINNMETTWKKGQIIYWAQNPPNESTKDDANTVSRGKPERVTALTQDVNISPYMTDEQKKMVKSIAKNYSGGWLDETKFEVARNPKTHWHLLFTLSKQEQPRISWSKDEEVNKYIYKHLFEMNPPDAIRAVIKNESTPSWILMFIAETNREFGTLAQNQLASRGWKIKTDKDKNPIVDMTNGAWIWTNSKKSNANISLSHRDLFAAKDAQLESLKQQKDQLELQSKQLTEKRRALEIQIEQRQNVLDQQSQTQTTTTPT